MVITASTNHFFSFHHFLGLHRITSPMNTISARTCIIPQRRTTVDSVVNVTMSSFPLSSRPAAIAMDLAVFGIDESQL